uniref:Uncharacterized protein n=1 Tax=Magnetococcus massalia (strain MO-1) TaxID=451514 RepID=A0A1S7LMR3_MAGMO|nr:Conserved protein of unknown function [Candidatus Magnetococcus massalia]
MVRLSPAVALSLLLPLLLLLPLQSRAEGESPQKSAKAPSSEQLWNQCGSQCHSFMSYRGGLGAGRWQHDIPHARYLHLLRRQLGITPEQQELWARFETAMLSIPPFARSFGPIHTLSGSNPHALSPHERGWVETKIKHVSQSYLCLYLKLNSLQQGRAVQFLGTPPKQAVTARCG